MSVVDLSGQLLQAVRDLRDSMAELEVRSRTSAEMDRAWRLARAQSFAQTEGTVQAREASVERETAHLRYEATCAENLRISALEAVRSNRTVVSAIQSLVAASRAEAELSKWESKETVSA
jgi:hypothetical protein